VGNSNLQAPHQQVVVGGEPVVGSGGEGGFSGGPALVEPGVAGFGSSADVVHAPDVVGGCGVHESGAVGGGQAVGVGEVAEAG
jgi:hypothetical protein